MRYLAAIIVLTGLTWDTAADGRCRRAHQPCGRASGWEKSSRVDLRWRLTPGQVFYQETTSETRQKLKVMGMAVDQRQKQWTVLRWQFDDWDDDGNAVFRCQIVDLNWDIDIGGNRITVYGLPASKPPSPLTDLTAALMKAELQVIVEHEGNVRKVRHTAAEFDKLLQNNPQIEPLAKNLLGGPSELARLVFNSMPNRIVSANKSWRHDSSSPLPDTPTLTSQFKDRLTYGGREKKLHRIELEGSSHYHGGLKALGVKLLRPPPEGKRRGTIWFDPVKLRLDNLTITSILSGAMELDIGGQATSVAIEQEQTTRVRVTDRPPTKK